MDGRRTALIVASDEFEHTGLSRLQAPAADAEALAAVLSDPDVGGFDVEVVHNEPSHSVQAHVEDLFAEGRPDDLLLLHFSGHGLKSDSGELFLAATNTRPDRLASTAVSADFVQRCMRGSRARSIVLFLDCCYGGAFGEGVAVRSAGPANVLDSFPAGKLGGGRGRAVITASSAMEYAFEGSALATDDQKQPSVFTSAVVEGLSSGAADRDEDGLVSLNELYDYVFDRVRAENPNQTPSRDIELQGELYVAKSQRRRVRAVPLPPDLRAAVQDGNMYTRLGAVGELRARLASADPGVALGARETLQDIARSDTSYVADAARDALASGAPAAAAHTAAAGPSPSPPPSPTPGETPAAFVTTPTSRPSPAAAAPERASPIPVTKPSRPVEPASRREVTPAARHRVSAGRTALTGGGLLLLSVLLPQYIYSASAFTFDRRTAFVLLGVGAVTVAVAIATLRLSSLHPRWRWPVVAMGAAGAVATVLLLGSTADLGPGDVNVGVWVALAGCLTTVAAGVVAIVGQRQPDTGGPGHSEAPALSPLARAVGHGALIASGAMISATFAVRFVHSLQALVEPNHVWAWLFPGFVGLIAGILTLRLRRQPSVGPALLVGAATSALWGLWDMPRIASEEGTSELGAGFFLELAGLVALVATGVGAVVLLRRDHGLTLGRPIGMPVAVTTVVGVLAAVPFVRVAQLNVENSETASAVHDLAMAVLVVLVCVLTAMTRPEVVGRIVLIGWSLGAAGVVVAYWRLLRHDGAALLGTPYVLLALTALVGVALVPRPRTQEPDPTS